MGLSQQKCVPCKGGVPALENEAVSRYLEQVCGWQADDEHKSISKKITFPNFDSSLVFVNRVGVVAEEANHHPDIAFGWGYCTITLNTHSIGGLHENDFIVAARIDQLLDEK